MEEYLQLNWSRKINRNKEEYERLFTHDIGKDRQDLWNLHLNETDETFVTNDETIFDAGDVIIDPRSKQVVTQTEVDCTKKGLKRQLRLHMDFPFASLLSFDQQMTGMKLLRNDKLHRQSSEEWDKLKLHLEAFEERLSEERQRFDAYLKDYMAGEISERLLQTNSVLVEIGHSLRKRQSEKIVPAAEQYQIQTAIVIKSFSANESSIAVEHNCNLRKMGIVPRLKFPTTRAMEFKLNIDLKSASQFSVKDPQFEIKFKEFIGTTGHKSSGIYLPLVAIQTLALTSLTKSWLIPFRIQKTGENRPTFIYFEDPLPKNNSESDRVIEANGRKACLLAMITKPNVRPYSFDEYRYLNVANANLIESDPDHSDFDDDEDGPKLVIEMDNNEVSDLPPQHAIEEPMGDSGCNREYHVIEIDKFMDQFKMKLSEKPKNVQNYITNRYDLIQAEGDNRNTIQINVSHSCDGVAYFAKDEFVTVSVKTDYVAEFGAQQMSLDELISEWCSLTFTDTVKYVCRVRVDAVHSLILSISYLTLADIEAELKRLYNIDTSLILTTFYSVLTLIRQFPEGGFILNHDYDSPQILVYMQTPGGNKCWRELIKHGASALSNSFEDVSATLPIDDQVLTRLHKIHSVLPGCVPFNCRPQRQMMNDRKRCMSKYEETRIKAATNRRDRLKAKKNKGKLISRRRKQQAKKAKAGDLQSGSGNEQVK